MSNPQLSNATSPSTPTTEAARPFNAINWFEVPTSNMDRAIPFSERMLGLTLRRETFGDQPHAVFPSKCPDGGSSVAGALVTGPHLRPGSSGAVVYFDCRDGVRATLARATAAGAKVVLAHTSIGEHGFIAIVDDPEGNRIGLHAMTT